MKGTRVADRLGAHVSTQGGVEFAPARAAAVGATALQLFTKTPNQWREKVIGPAQAEAFRRAMAEHGIAVAVSHDSYLINLASPDRSLRRRSLAAFVAELTRAETLGLAYVVSHPGNYIDHRERGLARNADGYREALERVPGRVMVLLETTAGSGTALGSRFEELAELVALIPAPFRRRVGFCADTCHLYAAGYDLRRHYDDVWEEWDRTLGFGRLRCLHLNDSKTPLGSHRDRHQHIGEGTLGPEPFRRIMRDPNLAHTVKIIETPKGDDMVTEDRRMLRRLRVYRRGGSASPR